MKTKTVRLFSLLLALCLLLAVLPLGGVRANADAKTYKTGDIITFGGYPQTRVTDSKTISALNKLPKNWVSYKYRWGDGTTMESMGSGTKIKAGDYMRYADVSYQGAWYRAVTFDTYRPRGVWLPTGTSTENTVQSWNGYDIKNVYYFRFEPLRWRVLDPNNGLVLCQSIIDAQSFHNTFYQGTGKYGYSLYQDAAMTRLAHDYGTSSIRQWLNADLYNTAFSAAEKNKIGILDIKCSVGYDSTQTVKDRVYLLSWEDASNAAYGFGSDQIGDNARKAEITDYARCQGGASDWILRSSSPAFPDMVSVVTSDGYLMNWANCGSTSEGIRPAFRFKSGIAADNNPNGGKGGNPYNLGEETYSFENYADLHAWGHCFGMAMTSAGYYLGVLDQTKIGLTGGKTLYQAPFTKTVTAPICTVQQMQGSFAAAAIVAGGSMDYKKDWNAVLNYVKSHAYDGSGSLMLSIRLADWSGHALNFLRYENVNGQDRLYAYDSYFPNTETYLYLSSSGIRQAPGNTYYAKKDIKYLAVSDVSKYFNAVNGFKASRVLYGEKGQITVEGASSSYMLDAADGGLWLMYELGAGVKTITVKPKTKGAVFTYMGKEYGFGGITKNTYATLTLSTTDNEAAAKPKFVLHNAPAYTPGDVTNGGEITAEDARLALRAAVGLENFGAGSAKFLASDVTKDGVIAAEDARLILRAAVGLEKLK